MVDGWGTIGNNSALPTVNAQCAEGQVLLGFSAAPGCLGVTQFQVQTTLQCMAGMQCYCAFDSAMQYFLQKRDRRSQCELVLICIYIFALCS